MRSSSPDRAAAHWINRRIRGRGSPPVSFNSHLIVRAIVAKQPQAISYLPLSAVSSSVTVLKVDGLLPSSADYPIRMKQAAR